MAAGPGDVVFSFGILFLALFFVRLFTGGKRARPLAVPAAQPAKADLRGQNPARAYAGLLTVFLFI